MLGRRERDRLAEELLRLRKERDKRTADFHLESELAAEKFKPRR